MFWVLQAVAMALVVWGNPYPKSSVLTAANRAIAWQHEQVAKVTDYFDLSSQNETLQAENAELRSMLSVLLEQQDDSIAKSIGDSVAGEIRYIPAHVVHSQRRGGHNYLTIDRGSADGLRSGMGVRSAEGAAGIVATVGEHYSLVVPIIHTRAILSTAILHDGYRCSLSWDGADYRTAQLQDVATHVRVNRGDTIVTSGVTEAFPAGIMVGVVSRCSLGNGDSYYTIDVRLATDFRRLRYVQVIDNPANREIEELNHEGL